MFGNKMSACAESGIFWSFDVIRTNRKMYYQILLMYLVPLIYMALGTQIQPTKSLQEFTERRKQLLAKEATLSLGGSLKLTPQEKTANKFLMKHKSDELDKGFKDISDFLPAASFLKISKYMEKRPLFKLLQKLPKGAVLHGHDTALVSAKYIVENITYRDNLYLKFDKNEVSEMRFFKQKPEDNKWISAKDIRTKKGKNYNNWMTKQLTLHDQYVGLSVNDVWKKFIGLFIKITPMLTYLPVWKDHFYQTLKEFYDDNVSYLEFRGTLPELYELNGTTLKEVDVCGVYVEVLAKFKKEYVKNDRFFDAKFIYAPLRFVNESEFQNYMRIAKELKQKYPDFIAGFDLVGQEDLGQPLKKFTQGLLDLKKANLDLFFHAGETKWSGLSTDKNLVDAVLLGTKRIGHGYAITKHPKVLQMVKNQNIGIEICPISNQVLGLVGDLRNHPLASLIMNNYPVVISSDDPGLWGATGVTYDWYETFVGIASRDQDLRLLKKLALNSIEQTSLDEIRKKQLSDDWQKRWDLYIKSVPNILNKK